MAKFKQGDHVFTTVWDTSVDEYVVREYTVQDVLGINLYCLTPGDRYAPESYVSDTQRGAEILATEKTIEEHTKRIAGLMEKVDRLKQHLEELQNGTDKG